MPVKISHTHQKHDKGKFVSLSFVYGATYQYYRQDARGWGSTIYHVEIPPPKDAEVKCLILIRIDGRILGYVDAKQEKNDIKKAECIVESESVGELYSSLSDEKASLTLESSPQISPESSGFQAGAFGFGYGRSKTVNVKVSKGRRTVPVIYTCGPIAVYDSSKDFSVTGSGYVFAYTKGCEKSYAKAMMMIYHSVEIRAYHVINGNKKLIFSWNHHADDSEN